MKSIILTGIKHCGKTTQGRLLASALGILFFDTDDLIAHACGTSVRTFYGTHGREAFMQAEAMACHTLAAVLTHIKKAAVISTGGGICTNPEAIAGLRPLGIFVFLRSSEKLACERILAEACFYPDGHIEGLPAYIASHEPRSESEVRRIFSQFYAERSRAYEELADYVFEAADKTIEENALLLKAAVEIALKAD